MSQQRSRYSMSPEEDGGRPPPQPEPDARADFQARPTRLGEEVVAAGEHPAAAAAADTHYAPIEDVGWGWGWGSGGGGGGSGEGGRLPPAARVPVGARGRADSTRAAVSDQGRRSVCAYEPIAKAIEKVSTVWAAGPRRGQDAGC